MVPRTIRLLAPAALLLAALVSLVAALQFGGGAEAPRFDPGAVVRYGVPISRLALDLTAATTIGALVLACFALGKEAAFDRAMDVASATAAAWTIAAGAATFFTYLSISGLQPSLDPTFGQQFGNYLVNFELGRLWLTATVVPAVVTVLCFAVRNRTAVALVAALGVVGLVPLALMGHAAGAASHDAAVSSLGLHLVFVSVWLGGLVTLVLIRGTLGPGRLVTVLARYSTLALVSFIVVAVSGTVNAAIRIGAIESILSPYGVLVIVKVLALVTLGGFGAFQRRFVIGRMVNDRVPERVGFWWLVVAEVVVMGVASGVAAGLAATPTPVAQEPFDSSPAALLTGEPLPPPLTFERYFTEWDFDILWVLITAFLAFFYLAGVWRLRHRGDRWPVYRTILWLVGLALLFYVTNGGMNVYEQFLFSSHMLAHMLIGMAVPLFLAPAAPVTLAMRAIKKRSDGSRGPREWILLTVQSRWAGFFSNPIVAGAFFASSLWIFYYSPLFRWAAEDHIGHTFMIVHFLLTGYLLVQALIGVDPLPYRAPYPMRLIVLLATMAFHAFFGLALMTGTGLLLADWYGAMGRDWGPSALEDQQIGGGIAWSVGEIPTIALAITVAVMWARSDEKEAKRLDRKDDRDGGADLNAYNDMLQKLDKRG